MIYARALLASSLVLLTGCLTERVMQNIEGTTVETKERVLARGVTRLVRAVDFQGVLFVEAEFSDGDRTVYLGRRLPPDFLKATLEVHPYQPPDGRAVHVVERHAQAPAGKPCVRLAGSLLETCEGNGIFSPLAEFPQRWKLVTVTRREKPDAVRLIVYIVALPFAALLDVMGIGWIVALAL